MRVAFAGAKLILRKGARASRSSKSFWRPLKVSVGKRDPGRRPRSSTKVTAAEAGGGGTVGVIAEE